MMVKGSLKGKIIHVLIDSGSTHNFIDVNTIKKLRMSIEVIPTFLAVVANGTKVRSQFKAQKVRWKM